MNQIQGPRTTGFYNKSLERALQILNVYDTDRQALTIVQLSKSLNLPKATVLRLCKTLTGYEFLAFDERTKRYSLGLKLFELGSLVFASFSVRRMAVPHLIALQVKTGKTVFLGILRNDEVVYIDKKDNPSSFIRFTSRTGQKRPAFYGMLGQTLMAYMGEHDVEELIKRHPLEAFTKKSITDPVLFKGRLEAIRSQGFCIDNGEAIDGITGVAAPVRDFSGRVIAAVGVGFLSLSEDKRGIRKVIRETLRCALAISVAMGWADRNGTRNLAIL